MHVLWVAIELAYQFRITGETHGALGLSELQYWSPPFNFLTFNGFIMIQYLQLSSVYNVWYGGQYNYGE